MWFWAVRKTQRGAHFAPLWARQGLDSLHLIIWPAALSLDPETSIGSCSPCPRVPSLFDPTFTYFCHWTYTRNSAIADKQRDAFKGQSRSPNMVPFHMLYMVPYYCAIVTLSIRNRNSISKMLLPWKPWSSKMSPFDTEPMTSCWRSIVTMARSVVIKSRLLSTISLVKWCSLAFFFW